MRTLTLTLTLTGTMTYAPAPLGHPLYLRGGIATARVFGIPLLLSLQINVEKSETSVESV